MSSSPARGKTRSSRLAELREYRTGSPARATTSPSLTSAVAIRGSRALPNTMNRSISSPESGSSSGRAFELAELLVVGEQRVHHVGDLVRSGLIAVGQQRHAQEEQFGSVSRSSLSGARTSQVSRSSPGCAPALCEQAGQIASQLQVGVLRLFRGARGRRDDRVGPAAEDMPVGGGDTEQLADDDRGENHKFLTALPIGA